MGQETCERLKRYHFANDSKLQSNDIFQGDGPVTDPNVTRRVPSSVKPTRVRWTNQCFLQVSHALDDDIWQKMMVLPLSMNADNIVYRNKVMSVFEEFQLTTRPKKSWKFQEVSLTTSGNKVIALCWKQRMECGIRSN